MVAPSSSYFREGVKSYVKQVPARWWCRSHALTGEHPQAHAAGGEGLHGVDQMGEVAAETVEFPDHQYIAFPQGGKHLSSPGRSARMPEAKSC